MLVSTRGVPPNRLFKKARPGFYRRAVLCLAMVGGFLSGASADDSRTGPDLLPPSIVICAEMAKPADLLKTVLEHPLWKQAERLHGYDKAAAGLNSVPLKMGVTFVEFKLGMTWKDAVAALTEGGVWSAIDAKDQASVVIARARDEKVLTKIRDVLVSLARDDAKNKKNPEPFEEVPYRDITIYKTKDGGFATVGPWLIIGNNKDLAKQVIDTLLDDKKGGLSEEPGFVAARKAVAGTPTIWAYTNIKAIRDAGVAPKAYSGKADDPGGELLVGGVLEALKSADYSVTTLNFGRDGLSLGVSLPCVTADISEHREYFFGPKGGGQAAALPKLDGMLFGLTSYRDISQMWLRAGDLFDEGMNEKLAQADSQLATLFSGKDFGEDILGAFAPQVQLIMTRQAFAADGLQPSIKLPAFAIAFDMKEPETSRREMKRIFQSFIGFLNVVGAMNGQPQLEQDVERTEQVELVTSSYIPEKGEEKSQQAKIQFNFSPTVAFHEKRFVLSSTKELARDLAAAEPDPSATNGPTNTALVLNTPILNELLKDNLSHLVAQNMLTEGSTREEAQEKLDDLLTILSFFKSASLDMKLANEQLQAELKFDLASEPAAPASPGAAKK
jgi:hypothetical protein